MTDISRRASASRRGLLALGGAAMVSGCSILPRQPAVPLASTLQATVLGLPNERFFPHQGIAPLEQEVVATLRRRDAHRAAGSSLNLIAISGGGEDGAYGAGLLCGWTEQGTRPVFDLVTGVSTGALTAPFAFLGADYDQQLRDVYTNTTLADVLRLRWLPTAVFNDALADTSPLYETIGRYLTPKMIADLGAAYRSGRMLLIGSTNLDAQLPVIWNVGAIAVSGHPRSGDIIRRIMLASAAIPGAFPPVMFDVTLDGTAHQEMHVDGGAVSQAFLYPPALTRERRALIARRQPVRDIRAYVIRNARFDAQWAAVDRRTMGIAGRAVSTMIASSGYNDIVRIYNTTRNDQVDYNLAFIGPEFTGVLKSPFEREYMRALFDFGYQRGRAGYNWAKQPPFLDGRADPALEQPIVVPPPRPGARRPAVT